MSGCWWRGHDWGKWEPIDLKLYDDGEYIATVTAMVRECKRCGWEKVRRT